MENVIITYTDYCLEIHKEIHNHKGFFRRSQQCKDLGAEYPSEWE